jgi:phosphatidate cytidylyltransferase
LAAAIVSGENWVFFGLIVLIGGIALVEWRRLLAESMPPTSAGWLYLVSAAYAAALIFPTWRVAPLWLSQIPEVVVIPVLLLGLFVIEFRHAPAGRETLWRLFSAAFGFFYIPLLLNFVWRLIEDPGLFYAFFVVAVTKFTDAGAYFFGVLFGRHKMVPHLSPGKTWEGLAGAFVGAFVISHGMVALWPEKLDRLDHVHAAILAFVLALVSVAADLAESLIKRCVGVKDSGKLLPGIGGALDLIDSLLFTAPLSWVYFQMLPLGPG